MDQMKKEGCAPCDAIVRILDWLPDGGQIEKLSDFVNDGSFISSCHGTIAKGVEYEGN